MKVLSSLFLSSRRCFQHLMFIGLALSAVVGMVALHRIHANDSSLFHPENAAASAGLVVFPEDEHGPAASSKVLTLAHHPSVNERTVVSTDATRRSMSAVSSVGSTDTIGSWKNPHNVVHVVSTRFHQHQAHLWHLAEARLELFRAFTLPSMKQQSQKEFLWMIWTDPELNESIRNTLVDLVQDLPNVLVVANEAVKDTTLRDLYGHTMTSLASSIIHGDATLLANYRAASQSHVLLETQLDADDALSGTFVDLVQTQAAEKLGQYVNHKESMEIICPFKHMEFRDFDFRLIDYQNTDFCIGSGTTTILHLEGNTRQLTLGGHCIYNELPVCKDLRPPSSNIFDHHPSLLRRRMVGGSTTDPQCLADRYIQEEELHIHDNPLVLHSDSEPLPHDHICPGQSMLCRTEHADGSGLEDHFWEAAWYPNGLSTGDHTKLICYPEGCEGTSVLAFDVEIGELNTNGEVVQVHVELAGWTGDEAWAITKGYAQFGSTGLEFCWEDDLPFGHALCGDDELGGAFYGNFHSGLYRTGLNHLDICVEPTFCWPEEERICRRRLKHAVRKTASQDATDQKHVLVNEGASVLLARTITAHGFKHVLPSNDPGTNSVALSTFDHAQDEAWDYVKNVFNISKASAYHVSSFIRDNKEAILVDAFNGQCTSGHSCKQSTKRALGKMLDQVRKN